MMTQPSPPQGWVWSPKQTWLHSMVGDSPWSRGSTSLPQKQAYPDSIPASCRTQKDSCKTLHQQFKNKLWVTLPITLFIINPFGMSDGEENIEGVHRQREQTLWTKHEAFGNGFYCFLNIKNNSKLSLWNYSQLHSNFAEKSNKFANT